MSLRSAITGIVGILLIAGCSEPQAVFVSSESTQGLSALARSGTDGESSIPGVEQHVAKRFGTPHDLVAWLKLPVDFGGTRGQFVEQEGSGPYRKLKVQLSDEPNLADGPVKLTILSGDDSGKSVEVVAYNAGSGTIELARESMLQTAPAKDTVFIIDAGETLRNGRHLYMLHCSHCHGTSGDGAGPTAEYLYPRPRDYRKGIFKFTSTVSKPSNQAKVCTDDLKRIIKNGIPGTYMPSFLLLTDDELHAIVEYVRWLSMRGEYEGKLVAELSSDFSEASINARIEGGETREEIESELREILGADLIDTANDAGEKIAGDWSDSNEPESQIVPSVPRVDDDAESRKRGRALFLSKKAQCKNCHGPLGLGNGPQTEDYEEDPVTKQLFDEPGLHDEWGHIVKPRNLKSGIYRGGRRPIDIFRRVYAGIKGAKMPAFGGPDGKGVLKDNEIWDIVNYVLSIPYEAPPEVDVQPEPESESSAN